MYGPVNSEKVKRAMDREYDRRHIAQMQVDTAPCNETAAIRDKGDIAVQLERLCKEIGCTDDAVARLTDKFGPVLKPIPMTCDDDALCNEAGPVRSDLAGVVATYANAVSRICERLNALYSRCEL